MTVLVIGGSGSGKSAYAETLSVTLSAEEGIPKYYVASMRVFDREGAEKVGKHRRLRRGKGFITVEQPTGIHRALRKMEPGKKTILLECVSNLTANEMFPEEGLRAEEQVAEEVISGIKKLKAEAMHLVIVTNNVFEDGIIYDEETKGYIRAMGRINQELASMSDKVLEVVAGIPIVIKQEE